MWSFQDFKYLLPKHSSDQKSGHDRNNDGKNEICFVGGLNGFFDVPHNYHQYSPMLTNTHTGCKDEKSKIYFVRGLNGFSPMCLTITTNTHQYTGYKDNKVRFALSED